jgi:hypothetical protein
MRFLKNILLFGLVGLVVALAITGLASVAPIAFGWLTAPFWVLPAIANLGDHDAGWPVALLSGSICYGVLAFFSVPPPKTKAEGNSPSIAGLGQFSMRAMA